MNLPHKEKAYVDRSKLIDYLLSEVHPVGRSKSKFFKRLGFSRDKANLLEKELLFIAKSENVVEVKKSEFGIKYIIDGILKGPSSEARKVRTIWIVEKGESLPRFVTAYPLMEKGK